MSAVSPRIALERRARELGASRDAERREGDRLAGYRSGLLREIDSLNQLDVRMCDDRSNADADAAVDLPRCARLDVDRLQRSLLRRKAARKIVLPLRGETIRHIDA